MKTVFKPAPTCLKCQKTIEQTKGNRLTAQRALGVCIVPAEESDGKKGNKHPISDTHVLCIWGNWTADQIKTAIQQARDGTHPWYCQQCSPMPLTCNLCNTPLRYPYGADWIGTNGQITHSAILPFNCGCTNPDCPNHKQWTP